MTQPLRQNVAIWIVVICVLEAGPHLFHLFPFSILQSEGLWQHKGLENTIRFRWRVPFWVNTEKARLLDVNINFIWIATDSVGFFLLDRLTAQTLRRRILWTHSISHDVFQYHACLVLCLLAFLGALSEHTRNAHNQSTHGTCCE